MGPEQRYQQLIKNGELLPDEQQVAVVAQLQRLYLALQQREKRTWWQRCVATAPIQGLYVWGGVGIGKTCMMDLFYQCLPGKRKLRTHFHRFMRQIHTKMIELQGQADPLVLVAKELATQTDIICFDEFFVNDIVDAMLLGNLLQALFSQGIVLVATSNIAPDDLYRHGLQRDRFLPAIVLLKQHTEVMQLMGAQDYRLQTHQRAGTFYQPLDKATRLRFKQHFVSLAGDAVVWHMPLTVDSRPLAPVAYAHGVAWFEFTEIIHIPHSQRDYLELAQCFHTVFISQVEAIAAKDDDVICNFIKLVDVFYDMQVKLVMQAAVSVDELYTQGRLLETFTRTKSRLTEMQSHEYLAKPHLVEMAIDEQQRREIE